MMQLKIINVTDATAYHKYCIVEDMKSPKEDYEIRKSVVSDPGTGEDLLIFLSFYTLVI